MSDLLNKAKGKATDVGQKAKELSAKARDKVLGRGSRSEEELDPYLEAAARNPPPFTVVSDPVPKKGILKNVKDALLPSKHHDEAEPGPPGEVFAAPSSVPTEPPPASAPPAQHSVEAPNFDGAGDGDTRPSTSYTGVASASAGPLSSAGTNYHTEDERRVRIKKTPTFNPAERAEAIEEGSLVERASIASNETTQSTLPRGEDGVPLDAAKNTPSEMKNILGAPQILHNHPEDSPNNRQGTQPRSYTHYGSGIE